MNKTIQEAACHSLSESELSQSLKNWMDISDILLGDACRLWMFRTNYRLANMSLSRREFLPQYQGSGRFRFVPGPKCALRVCVRLAGHAIHVLPALLSTSNVVFLFALENGFGQASRTRMRLNSHVHRCTLRRGGRGGGEGGGGRVALSSTSLLEEATE